jgi:hypothetical protein
MSMQHRHRKSMMLCVDPVVLGPAREGDEETGKREREKRSKRERRKCRRQEAENGTGWNVHGCGWVHVCMHA